jgi:hypothetical protein
MSFHPYLNVQVQRTVTYLTTVSIIFRQRPLLMGHWVAFRDDDDYRFKFLNREFKISNWIIARCVVKCCIEMKKYNFSLRSRDLKTHRQCIITVKSTIQLITNEAMRNEKISDKISRFDLLVYNRGWKHQAMTKANPSERLKYKYLYLYTWLMGFNLDEKRKMKETANKQRFQSFRFCSNPNLDI